MPEVDEAADIEEVQAWAAGLDALLARIAGLFARAEPRRRVLAYLRGYCGCGSSRMCSKTCRAITAPRLVPTAALEPAEPPWVATRIG